jgi:hypothetical protein
VSDAILPSVGFQLTTVMYMALQTDAFATCMGLRNLEWCCGSHAHAVNLNPSCRPLAFFAFIFKPVPCLMLAHGLAPLLSGRLALAFKGSTDFLVDSVRTSSTLAAPNVEPP